MNDEPGQTRGASGAFIVHRSSFIVSPPRLFLLLGCVAGLAFAFLTPPCYVPDEVAHLWRAASIAHGTIVPATTERGVVAPLPKGYQEIVFCLFRDIAGQPERKLERDQFRVAWEVRQQPETRVDLQVVSSYSPVNYLPQIAAAFIGRVTGARPLLIFYLGRLFALAAFLAIVYVAIRTTPVLQWAFCFVALLPMTLFLAASWSADAMTIALSFLVTALSLRGARGIVSALALGLCKPPYFFVSGIALGRKQWLMPVAAAAGFAGMYALASQTQPIAAGSSGQWQCLTREPLLVVRSFVQQFPSYADQLVGRLGQLDVILPRPIMWLAWLFLIVLFLANGESIPRAQRLLALLAVVGTILFVSITMYLAWTAPCAGTIAGIQGRYFLPVLPALYVALANPWWRWRRVGAWEAGAVAGVLNVVAVIILAGRYYGW